MKFSTIASCLIGMLICALTAAAQNPPHDDHQLWDDVQITKALAPNRDLVLSGQLRIGQEFQSTVEEQIGAALAFKLNSHLTLAPAYSFIAQQPYPGRRVNQHRIVFAATGKFTWRNFTFTDRNQFERRFVLANPDSTVYRQRLTIDHPVHIGAFKFRAFIWDEVRYSSLNLAAGGRLGWYRNRLALGVSKQLNEQLTVDVFYLRQNDGVSRPGNIHAVGLTLRVFLKAASKPPKMEKSG